MSKTKSSQKKVSLSELNNHTVNNKRQALKELEKNFESLQADPSFLQFVPLLIP